MKERVTVNDDASENQKLFTVLQSWPSSTKATMCFGTKSVLMQHQTDNGCVTHTHTFRLVLDRGADESAILHPSVAEVSVLFWGSGIISEVRPDEGKIPKERGRSLLVD